MILHFNDVSYRYSTLDAWTLQKIDLTISQSQKVLLTGASGSGKSTFCRACVALIPHFHGGEFIGQVFINGLNSREHPVYQIFSHAGLVFQNPEAQLFNQTVEAELVYGLESLGLTPAEIEKRLSHVNDQIGLESLLSRSPSKLSGGEKQKVALSAILVLQPKLLLLDEPFTHLDSEEAETLRAIIRKISAEGVSVVVVEHRLHELIGEVDRLVILHQGRIVEDGYPRQVMGQDVTGYGLNLPPLIRLFKKMGWKGLPFNVNEALQELESQNLLSSLPMRPCSSLRPNEDRDRVVEMEDVSFRYNGSEVLCGVNLIFTKGECVAILGRNGAGKTTLVKHLNGLLKPTRGWVRILGQNTLRTPVSQLARHVGFVWQNANDQLFQPTVRDEILTGPKTLNAYDPIWCDRLFERFQLGSLLDRSPFRLSEGQKKRVSFASAMAVRPDLIVLDEPTAGQDESFRQELGLLIKELLSAGRTIVIVTHDLEFASTYATRWIALADGLIVADGSPEAVMGDTMAMTKAGLRPTQEFQLFEEIKKRRG